MSSGKPRSVTWGEWRYVQLEQWAGYYREGYDSNGMARPRTAEWWSMLLNLSCLGRKVEDWDAEGTRAIPRQADVAGITQGFARTSVQDDAPFGSPFAEDGGYIHTANPATQGTLR